MTASAMITGEVAQTTPRAAALRLAVLVPCHNEAPTIANVVGDFRARLPTAIVYVYDNNSTDDTMAVARAAGAVVRRERLQGKGNVVRRMFADVEADIYLLVDGDDTYEAENAPEMVRLVAEDGMDMVTASRQWEDSAASQRPGHHFGNQVLTGIVAWVFGDRVSDILSGYRAFSRRFVKSFPALSAGFETETEFTVHALELRMPVGEVTTRYSARIAGSASKLNTIRDGLRILRMIFALVKEERPLPVFGIMALVLVGAGLAAGIPVIAHFLESGLVPRLPTAVAATGLVLLGFLSLFSGLILDTVTRGRREAKRMAYLAVPGPLNHRPQ